MKYEELVERVSWEEEFSFEYRGNKYWISQNSNARYLTRVEDGYSQEFKSTRELFNKAQIDGKTMLQIWEKIRYQF